MYTVSWVTLAETELTHLSMFTSKEQKLKVNKYD